MRIQAFCLGPLDNNMYILSDEQERFLIIDAPVGTAEIISKHLGAHPQAELHGLILTHGHLDHINDVQELQSSFKAKIMGHSADEFFFAQPKLMQSYFSRSNFKFNSFNCDQYFSTDEELSLIGLELKILHTPGHSPGGICIFVKNGNSGVVFTGDTLFKGSIGRWDLPGGNKELLLRSIKDKILGLSDTVQIYPGHGMQTTVLTELETNYYLKS